MKYCINCGKPVTWNKQSNLCSDFYEKQLKIKIIEDDRKVELRWFQNNLVG